MNEIVVRAFRETDRVALREVFGRARQSAPTASLWGHEESEADVYLTAYMDHEPESLFLAFVDGALAGYLAGSLGDGALPCENTRLQRAVRDHRLLFRPRPAAFFARSAWDLAGAAWRREATPGEFHDSRWPAHLHINLVPESRGAGAAPTLMQCWFERLRETGSGGCYLQTLVENTRAVRFFERMGFTGHGPRPLVPGLRHNGGRVHQRTMVWSP